MNLPDRRVGHLVSGWCLAAVTIVAVAGACPAPAASDPKEITEPTAAVVEPPDWKEESFYQQISRAVIRLQGPPSKNRCLPFSHPLEPGPL